MSITAINIGNFVNDGLGDDLRVAFQKVNANFATLDNQLSVTGKNLGSGARIFKQKTNYDLELRSLVGGTNVNLVENSDNITINSPLQNTFNSIVTSNGNVDAVSPTTQLTFQGGNNIVITKSGNTIVFDANLVAVNLEEDLNLNGHSILGLGNINITGNITATNLFGNLLGYNSQALVSGVFDYNFGSITQGNYINATEFLFSQLDWDFGTVTSPGTYELDLGTI